MFFVLGEIAPDQFLMVNATSQVEKGLSQLRRRMQRFGCTAESVSVQFRPGEHPFISKDTLVDCSAPWRLSVEQLMNGVEFRLLAEPPNAFFFEAILRAWAASPRTLPAHLNAVREQWAPLGITL